MKTFADAPWGVFGMAVDAETRRALGDDRRAAAGRGFSAEDKGKSALLRIDLASGRVLETLRGRLKSEHHFGDVAVAADGEVYVSDSAVAGDLPGVVNGNALEPFVRGPFASMQGLAPARNVLYVADYSQGPLRRRSAHARHPPAARAAECVAPRRRRSLLASTSRRSSATQNGTNPNRILRIRLAPGGLAVSSVETLLANAAGMGDPTLGVVAGKRFFFNANAQWDLFGDDGKICRPVEAFRAVVLSVSGPSDALTAEGILCERYRVVTAGIGVLVFDGFRAGLSKAADRPLFLL